MRLDELPGGAMQITRAGVIAQARPQVQHFVERGRGQTADIGKATHEALVIADHGGDLRLLQHDLRNPDSIGGALALPGQIMAPVARVPAAQCCRQGFHAARSIGVA